MIATAHPTPTDVRRLAEDLYGIVFPDRLGPGHTLATYVYRELWCRIVSRELKPGQRVHDFEVAPELSVSPTPVREAFRQLANDGLLVGRARRGFTVVDLTAADVVELWDLRQVLEVAATRRATGRMSSDEVHAMLGRFEDLAARADEISMAEYYASDMRFHNAIFAASGNARMAAVMRGIRAQVSIFQIESDLPPAAVRSGMEMHARILARMAEGDVEGAASAMAEHIEYAKQQALRVFFPDAGAEGGAA